MSIEGEIVNAGCSAQLAPLRYAADRNPARSYINGLASGSRRTMAQALNVIAGIMTAVAWRMGYMNADDYQAAIDVKTVAGVRKLNATRPSWRRLRTFLLA